MTAARIVPRRLLFWSLIPTSHAWITVNFISYRNGLDLSQTTSLEAAKADESSSSSLIDDGSGHVRSELAASIWNWDHEHRLHDKQKQEKFPFSTRAGLRWVDEIAKHMLESLDETSGSASSTSSSSHTLAQDSSARSYSDLVQEGVVALLHVMSNYPSHMDQSDDQSKKDDDNGETGKAQQHSFEMYARRYIADRMRKSLASDARPIKIPSRIQSLLNHARRVRQKLLDENNGREPTVAQVADRLGVTADKLELYQLVSGGTLSMERTMEIYDPLLDGTATFADQDTWESQHFNDVEEEPLEDNEEGDDEMWVHQEQIAAPLRDIIPDYDTPDKHLSTELMQHDVEEFLVRTLDDVEVQVVRMRFGLHRGSGKPMPYTDVASALQLSPTRVRQLETQALEKLKDSAKSQLLEPYLEDESSDTDDLL